MRPWYQQGSLAVYGHTPGEWLHVHIKRPYGLRPKSEYFESISEGVWSSCLIPPSAAVTTHQNAWHNVINTRNYLIIIIGIAQILFDYNSMGEELLLDNRLSNYSGHLHIVASWDNPQLCNK